MAFTLKSSKTEFNKKPSASGLNYQKLNCIVKRFRYKDEENGFFVFQAQLLDSEPNIDVKINNKTYNDRQFSVVGTSLLFVENVVDGQEIEVWGTFEAGKQADTMQFGATAIQETIPHQPRSIELFLSSGKISGVGAKKAKKIVTKFGSKTIAVLDNNPELLLEVEGITEKILDGIMSSWKEWRSVYEIAATMRFYEIPDGAAVKIYNHFKEKSIPIIKTEPYLLTEVPTIGFKTADKIAQALGISPIDDQRIEKCILYTLEDIADKGNTAYPKEDLAFKVNELLKIAPNLVEQKLENLITKGELIPKKIKMKSFKNKFSNTFDILEKDGVAHKKVHYAEVRIAKELKRLYNFPILESQEESNNHIKNFLLENPYKLDDSQLEAAKNILFNKVSVLTGGPGTGKTHTIKSLLNYFDSVSKSAHYVYDNPHEEEVGLDSVLSAPTGRASKRMEELTGKSSSTIHRLLGFKDGVFFHDENNPLEGDVFIVDESSMIDIWLMSAFLKAIPSTARLIFVGDADQLPSVGAGDVFKDMINSGKVPVSILAMIHRQALGSNIIVAAHAINNKQVPPLYSIDSPSDFAFVESDNDVDIHDNMLAIVADLLSKGVSHNDIQILSPKKDSEVGTHKLNMSMRGLLNPQFVDYQDSNSKFVPGDRVMQFKNNKELEIYNGDTGIVQSVDIENANVVVNFDNKIVDINGANIKNLNLAYATTIHKSQGSDYPYVIIPLSKGHTFMWDIKLLYTAVTRGKSRVILVGDKKTLSYCVSTFKQVDRITGLKDALIAAFDEPEVNNSYRPY